MEVRTADDVGFSLTTALLYFGIAATSVALVFVPSLFWRAYPHVVSTAILLAIWGLVLRRILGGAIGLLDVETPSIPEDATLPTVSVVIPAYNEAPVLPETIDACTRLDYPTEKLEVILCYEADSTAETGAIAERAAAEHAFVEAIERDEPAGGKASGANYALDSASGEIIASIDADHQFHPAAVRRAVA